LKISRRKYFEKGRLEIRCKLEATQGAWPSLWMDPDAPWPAGGEIDIVERLNYEPFVHHTVHSTYTQAGKKDKSKRTPPSTATAPINPDDYNIYAVELDTDEVRFYVNGKQTFSYARVPEKESEGQFPFNRPYMLRIDMQLGGSWVGEVKPFILERLGKIGLDFQPQAFPTELLTISNQKGVRMRATISEFGAVLLSRILDLSDIQEGVLAVVFKYCDDHALPLLDLKDLKDGADVAIPSDPTNLARALRLLDHAKVITLKDPNSFTVTEADIKDNPKHLKFTKVSLLNLNEAYNEKDLVFNYPTYISKLGLTPDKNGLALEKADDLTFAISLVAREDNKDDAKVQAVKKALASEKIKDYINKELKPKGHATPAF